MSDLNDPRVFFAAERTLLAWNRTSLAIMAFGFVVERFGLFMRLLAPEHATPLEKGYSYWRGIACRMLCCGSETRPLKQINGQSRSQNGYRQVGEHAQIYGVTLGDFDGLQGSQELPILHYRDDGKNSAQKDTAAILSPAYLGRNSCRRISDLYVKKSSSSYHCLPR